MATKNKYAYEKMVNGKAVKFTTFKGQEVKLTDVCKLTTLQICKDLGLTYCDGINDHGVDAIDKNGKRFQIKVYYENSPSITLDIDYLKAIGKSGNAKYLYREALKKYCKNFDCLIVYVGTLRGEPYDISKALIIEGYDAMYEYLLLHCHRSYMRYIDEAKNGRFNNGRAQLPLRKNERKELIARA